MDTERVLGTAALQLAQEDDTIVNFFHTHIVVLDAPEVLLHLVEFVVVGGEECARLCLGMLVQVLHNRPRDGNAIAGGGAATEFVEEHQRAGRDVVQDIRCLGHFHHERGFAERNVIGSTHTGENLVNESYMRTLGGHKTANLRQQYDEGRLAQQGTLTGHVRTSNDDYLLFLIVKINIIRHILFAQGQLGLDNGMATLMNVDDRTLINHRSDVLIFLRNLGKREQTVEACRLHSIGLNSRDKTLHINH